MREPLRYAVVGCGRIAPLHLEAIGGHPRARLAATCDIVGERARRAAQRFGAPVHTTSYEELFASSAVDAVSLALPHHLHGEAIVAAAEAGLHVFCEKPIAIGPEEADRAIAACRRAGVQLGVCYQNRYNQASQLLRGAVDAGRFGTLLQAAITFQNRKEPGYYTRDEWRGRWATEGGGVLTTQGIHTLDLMLWLMGPARQAAGRIATLVHEVEVEDTAAATIEFASGALGVITATTGSHTSWSQRLELSGTKGKAVLHNNRLVEWEFADGAPDRQEALAVDEPAGAPDERGRYGPGHRRILAHFVDCVLDGRPFPLDGGEGRKISELLWVIYESARFRRGAPVRLDSPQREDRHHHDG
ncbi:MAG: Gfo/Idh/MocA family protein [Candidatus Brocadiia bacterium]